MSRSTKNLRTVERIDLARYMGDWHVIAHVPYLLEKGKVGTIDRYALRTDGRIDVEFVFRKKTFDAPEEKWTGVAWVTERATNAEWRVRFLWPFSASYRVLELDPDYRWATVSTGDGDLIWILARARALDALIYADLVGRIRARGLEADKLVKVPQPTS
jgi:apolipoprotein D and lipocalin family protein